MQLHPILLLVIFCLNTAHRNIRAAWSAYLLSALVNVVLYYGLQTIGLQYLPSGLSPFSSRSSPFLLEPYSFLSRSRYHCWRVLSFFS